MSLENKTTEVLNIAEDMMGRMIRESGTEVLEGLANMDSEEANMTLSALKMYYAAKELAVEQAKVMDKMQETIDTLGDMNSKMFQKMVEQNYEINNKLNKLLEKDSGKHEVKKA